MAMEAFTRAASIDCYGASLRLSRPQTRPPRLSAAKGRTWLSHNGGLSNALVTLAPWTYSNARNYKASPPCQCSVASSTYVADQRLDFTLSVGSAVIPHPAKVEKGGEDAFFASSRNGGVLGVADGVSGLVPVLGSYWGKLMKLLLQSALRLQRETGILHVANLGDCGLRVMREGRIVFATSTQQHYFDCPYQLSSEPGAQTSEDAMVYKVELLPGDIVVMGSDGLFDNVFDKEIESTVNIFGRFDDDTPQRIASALASLASKHSRDTKYESPYSQEAIFQGYDLPLWKRLLGQKLTGGKLDDITVLTAHVMVSPALPKEPPVVSVQEEASPFPVEEANTDFTPNELLAPAV